MKAFAQQIFTCCIVVDQPVALGKGALRVCQLAEFRLVAQPR